MAGAGLNKDTPLANTHPFPVGYYLGAATATTFQLQDASFLNSATRYLLAKGAKNILLHSQIGRLQAAGADFKVLPLYSFSPTGSLKTRLKLEHNYNVLTRCLPHPKSLNYRKILTMQQSMHL